VIFKEKKNIPLIGASAISVIAMALAGCQGANLGAPMLSMGLMGPQLPPAQVAAMKSAVLQSAQAQGGSQLVQNVRQAMPAILSLLTSFAEHGNPCGAEMYKAPGNNANFNYGWDCDDRYGASSGWPVNAPKTEPLIVQSVGDWKSKSANEFSFMANLCSPVSQTCVSGGGTFINLGSGWQITRASRYN
jgi:hypothetical protein